METKNHAMLNRALLYATA